MNCSVLQLIGSFDQGGSEQQAVQLIRLLTATGRYRVHVACLDPRGPLRQQIEHVVDGDMAEFPLTSFYDLNAATQLQRFVQLLRELRIDILQTHDFYTNVFGMAAGRLARVPVRIAARRETTGWRTSAQKSVERIAYRLSSAIVANSEAVRARLIDEGVGTDKISTIYNGVELSRMATPAGHTREAALASLGLPADRDLRFVTILANLRHSVKDHPTFLRAARLVRESEGSARFIVAGEGELSNSIRALAAETRLDNDVFFIGRCDKVAELLSVSDVCVLSSKAEGFSNAILEYMAAGRPVVATNVGGAREAVLDGETGFIVPPGDWSSMAARILNLLADREAALRMGARGRQVVEQKFSCNALLERTETLYRQLLGRREETRALVVKSIAREAK